MKRIIIIALVLIALVALIAWRFNTPAGNPGSHHTQENYIFDKSFDAQKVLIPDGDNPYLAKGAVNARALELFHRLDKLYSPSSGGLSAHYKYAGRYFNENFNETDARVLSEAYKKYFSCQTRLFHDRHFDPKITGFEDMLKLLYDVQSFRRESMGAQTADALFGAEVKEMEYILRREMIITDKSLFGAEKEKRLASLKSDMWEGQDIALGEDDNAYNLYQLKMQLYSKDLSMLVEKERALKIKEIRREFFTKEQIEKLNETDSLIARECETLRLYRQAEKKIKSAPDLPPEVRAQNIHALQDEHFGDQADAFRRTESIEHGLKKE